MTVKAVSEATMARDALSKILDFEATLQTGGKEAAKRRDNSGKKCNDTGVNLGR